MKSSNVKYIDATLTEVVNIKEATTFEKVSKSRDQNTPKKEEILKGHERHDAFKVSGIAHNRCKEIIKLVFRGSINNSSPTYLLLKISQANSRIFRNSGELEEDL